MATRFITKALVTAALGIALILMLAAPNAPSPAWGNTPGALQLDTPAAPSDCRATSRFHRDRRGGKNGDYTSSVVSWTDNSTNEDGFTVERWRRQVGVWGLWDSTSMAANSTGYEFIYYGSDRPNFRFRVKAFNASGESAWSNWSN